MKLSLSQAAKQTGLNKSTILRAIKKDGPAKLSADRLDDGTYAIDPAELERWLHSTGHGNRGAQRIAPEENAPETGMISKALEVELKALQQRFDMLETERRRERELLTDQLDDVRKDRDKWRDLAEGQQRMIVDARTEAEKRAAERPKGLAGWFGRRSA